MQQGPDDKTRKDRELLLYLEYLSQTIDKEIAFAEHVKSQQTDLPSWDHKIEKYLATISDHRDWEIRKDHKEIVSKVLDKESAIALSQSFDSDLFPKNIPQGVVKSRSASGYRVVLNLNAVEEKVSQVSQPTRSNSM